MSMTLGMGHERDSVSEAERVRNRIGSMMADGNIASVKLTKARKSYSCDGQKNDGRCGTKIHPGENYVRVVSNQMWSQHDKYGYRTSYVICLSCAGVKVN